MALTHYPVVNKNGDTIASAVTNLDLHDIARAARTYGLRRFYVITPLEDQQRLIKRIVDHWVCGVGGKTNPARREALALIGICDDIQGAVEDIRQETGLTPNVVVTCARPGPARISFASFREKLAAGKPHLLVLGTAWGLSETLITTADYVLEPIQGGTDYNHLSVRCAAAIMLDRLLGTP
ncbi:MAG: RNA methyltransferase [Desulfobacterales bacterium]|nr:RNA methyltransferase [Desulfobacterales bacterium]